MGFQGYSSGLHFISTQTCLSYRIVFAFNLFFIGLEKIYWTLPHIQRFWNKGTANIFPLSLKVNKFLPSMLQHFWNFLEKRLYNLDKNHLISRKSFIILVFLQFCKQLVVTSSQIWRLWQIFNQFKVDFSYYNFYRRLWAST